MPESTVQDADEGTQYRQRNGQRAVDTTRCLIRGSLKPGELLEKRPARQRVERRPHESNENGCGPKSDNCDTSDDSEPLPDSIRSSCLSSHNCAGNLLASEARPAAPDAGKSRSAAVHTRIAGRVGQGEAPRKVTAELLLIPLLRDLARMSTISPQT